MESPDAKRFIRCNVVCAPDWSAFAREKLRGHEDETSIDFWLR